MGGISISYRRDDSTGWAGRLSEHLKGRLGQEALLSGDAIEPDVHDTNALHAYDAFISYSRKDEAFASAFEKALEAYTPPKDLKVPQRPLDIFRDKEDFTGNDYVQSLEKYLHCSSKLIVLCSPSARQSPFVNDEIRRFAKAKGSKHIIPLLIAGLPNNEAMPDQEHEKAFPEALLESMAMPLAAEYRGFGAWNDSINKGAFEGPWHTTLANLYGVSRRGIEQRETKRRTARSLQIFMAILLTLVVAGGWRLYETHRSESLELAAKSTQASTEGL